MSAPARLGIFGFLLAAALGIGAALGAAAGPIDVGRGAEHPAAEHTTTTLVDDLPTTTVHPVEHEVGP